MYYGFVRDGSREVYRRVQDGSDEYLVPYVDKTHPHSPGFHWGYMGVGPKETALTILADYSGGPLARQFDLFEQFAEEVVAEWPMDREWSLSERDLVAWLGPRVASLWGDIVDPTPSSIPIEETNTAEEQFELLQGATKVLARYLQIKGLAWG